MNNLYAQIEDNIQENQHPFIGSGSARDVYDLGNGYVVKVAKNSKGYAQNSVEYLIYMREKSPVLAPIMDISQNKKYIIMEKAEPVYNPAVIKWYYHMYYMRDLQSVYEVRILTRRYGLLYDDLVRMSSWGTINNRPVLVDYGYTREVRRRYY